MTRFLFMTGLVCGLVAVAACGDDETSSTTATNTTSPSSSSAGGNTTSSGGSGGMAQGGAGGAASCLPTGAACTMTDTCCDYAGQTGVCHGFMMGNAPACTIPCPPDANDCPAGNGCNQMNVCKIN
jgi:hypothetical protein